MLLLAIDTTTNVCSVALGERDKLWAEIVLNTKKTHSQRLMPALQTLLRDTGVDKKQLAGIAVALGPGSFTGIRIGIATAQGLAQGLEIPLIGVITLDALSESCGFFPGLICPLLDARRGEVYTGLYRGGSGGPTPIEAPNAMIIDDVAVKLAKYRENVIFTGDALELYRDILQEALGEKYLETPAASRLNRAALVLQRGLRNIDDFETWSNLPQKSLKPVKPFYLRLPEAERRLQEKEKIMALEGNKERDRDTDRR
jgi:tRNA threonylcarbamoyladenosine biosynthesis protein TsaB